MCSSLLHDYTMGHGYNIIVWNKTIIGMRFFPTSVNIIYFYVCLVDYVPNIILFIIELCINYSMWTAVSSISQSTLNIKKTILRYALTIILIDQR